RIVDARAAPFGALRITDRSKPSAVLWSRPLAAEALAAPHRWPPSRLRRRPPPRQAPPRYLPRLPAAPLRQRASRFATATAPRPRARFAPRPPPRRADS